MNFITAVEAVKAFGLVLIGVGLVMNATERIRERKNGKRKDRREA